MKTFARTSFLLALSFLIIIGIYLLQVWFYAFTQDDAFISYRYVQNFLGGKGLVFNNGEQVEGFTNFFWVIILALSGSWGLDIIIVSKILGIVSGCVLLFVLFGFSRRLEPPQPWYYHLAVPFWLAAAAVFAYWSISGLEEAFFTTCVVTGVFLYLFRPVWSLPLFILAAVIRPEGALIFGLVELGGLIYLERDWKRLFQDVIIFIIFVAPLYSFRLWYYGQILPNTFYAKTELSWAYLQSGINYHWLFFKQYGLFGGIPILIIAGYRLFSPRERLILFLVGGYCLYILIIGGDWLQGHRFFLPIFPLLLLLFQRVIWLGSQVLSRQYSGFGALYKAAIVGCATLFVLLPWQQMRTIHFWSKALVEKMTLLSKAFTYFTPNEASIALSDIGAFSYNLRNRIVIDLWGLTDTYIPRHPKPVPGIKSGWKERTYNVEYVLARQPDYILFSTNPKPVTPVEQALFLYSGFRSGYSLCYFSVESELYSVFHRTKVVPEKSELWPHPEFLSPLRRGLSLTLGQRAGLLKEALAIAPKDFAFLWNEIAFDYWKAGNIDSAITYNKVSLMLDSLSGVTYLVKWLISQAQGNLSEADSLLRILYRVNPEIMGVTGWQRGGQ